MDAGFGARLRAQRERQQVALSTIAEQTKIRLSLLEELEHDNVSHWPSGIFRRSYLRTYAQAIGLDPEETVREFLALYPDTLDGTPAGTAATHAVAVEDSSSRRPRTRLQYMIDSAIGALPQLFQSDHKGGSTAGVDPADVSDRPDRPEGPQSTGETPADDIPAQAERALVTRTSLDIRPDMVDEATAHGVDLPAMAHLCTRIARAMDPGDVAPLMADAARIFEAVGIILWIWDAKRAVLWPALNHGYTYEVLARLPLVHTDSDNAIAAAFRASETRVVDSSGSTTGAVVVPVIAPTGCGGVLAVELPSGGERRESVHALATILAAQLSILVDAPPVARSATA